MQKTLASELASLVLAIRNCEKSGNTEWYNRHSDRLKVLVADNMPRGSGIDSYPWLDMDKSTPDKLVFHFGYHHMNDGRYYDGWTEHTCTVKASLWSGLDISISGPNRNDIKEYLHEVFSSALSELV